MAVNKFTFYSSLNNNSINTAMKESARHGAKLWEFAGPDYLTGVMVCERALSMAFPAGIRVF
jgi:hypothetical protein